MKRLLDITISPASTNLPFTGSTSMLGEAENGNFCGLVYLLGEYSPFLREYSVYEKSGQAKKKKQLIIYLGEHRMSSFPCVGKRYYIKL